MTSRPAWRTAALLAGLAICALIVLWRAVIASQVMGDAATSTTGGAQPVLAGRTMAAPRTPARAPIGHQAAPPLDPSAPPSETVDPCTAVNEPSPPAGYETVTVQGITVAWRADASPLRPSDPPLKPALLARITAGIVDEAAEATGTSPRSTLTVIVFPSQEEFHAATDAPTWASGLYNGAVAIPAETRHDLGVNLTALRHEVMHAQLHSAVGCMPAWFNEGMATLFSDRPPVDAWIAMERDRALFSLRGLDARAQPELTKANVELFYAQSAAMVLYVLGRFDGVDMRGAIRSLVTVGDDDERRTSLWKLSFAQVDESALLDALARRMFGLSTTASAAALGGVVCCTSLRDLRGLACHEGPASGNPTDVAQWVDAAHTPFAMCFAKKH